MSDITIWHNPRCSKSRETLALLRQHGIEPHVRLYMDDTPGVEELTAVLHKLGLDSARDWMRTKEAAYKARGLKDETDEAALLQAMSEEPKLIERPVLIHGERAALGRPPERVLDIV